MCGIVYGKRRDSRNVIKSLLKRYEGQKHRGTQGFGYVVIQNGHVVDVKRAKYEYHIREFLAQEDNASEILFHHRMPTSTENLEEVTHPIVVKNDLLDHNYYVVHNGVLFNEDEQKKEYEAMGFKYTTDIITKTITEIGGKTISEEETVGFNDSESFAIDLSLFLDGKKDEIESIGTIAFICIQTDKKNKVVAIHYGRNGGNPLVLEDNNDILFLKSLGGGKDVPEDVLHTSDYVTGNVTTRDVKIGSRNTNNWNYRGQGKDDEDDNDPKETTVIQIEEPKDRDDSAYGVDQPKMGFNRSDIETSFDTSLEGMFNPDERSDAFNRHYLGEESYFTSSDRYQDILAEIDVLEDDNKYAKKELKKGRKGGGVTSELKIFYDETLKENKEKLESLNSELEFLKDFGVENH